MGGQPGKPSPPGNPPVKPDLDRPAPVEEPPPPIPLPPLEPPPAPMAVRGWRGRYSDCGPSPVVPTSPGLRSILSTSPACSSSA
jgi:hypothetical protein